MKNRYRIKIKEWNEIKEFGSLPIKHTTYTVEKLFVKTNWFERLFGFKDSWWIVSAHTTLDDAIKFMRNEYNRDNAKIDYYELE